VTPKTGRTPPDNEDVPALSPAARRILAATSMNALGRGFTLPFLLIYLHSVRGIPLPVTGLVLASLGAVGVAAGPVLGTAIDRFGARRVLLAALGVSTVGAVLLTQVHSTWQAFLAVAVTGIGGSASWPATNALLSGVTTPEQRSRAFAVEFTLLNAGIGIGGLVGGLIADTSRPGTFELLYAVDGASFVLAAAILLTLRRGVGGPVERPAPEPGVPDGWRHVLADRRMWWLCLLFFVVVTAGYAQVDSGFPAFATEVAGVSTRVIGVAFAVNTAVIVLGQLLVLKRLEGRRRTRAVAGFGVLIACSWALFGLSALASPGAAATLVVVSLGVFGLGETLWSPSGNALVNGLAPPHLRGRYNALGSLTWQLAGMVGPILSGVMLGAGHPGAYIVALLVACAAAVILALALERRLTPAENGVFAAVAVGPPPLPTGATAGPAER
jgi:MFS family permease